MQWWIPSPKPTWRFGSRSKSSCSGFSKRRSSWLAAPKQSQTRAPVGIVPPAMSTSSSATRASPWTGASQRTSSSVARVANSGSSAIRRRSSGRSQSRCSPLQTRQAVVSTPAMTRMKVMPRASSGARIALVFGLDQGREQVVARGGAAGGDLLVDEAGQPFRRFPRDRRDLEVVAAARPPSGSRVSKSKRRSASGSCLLGEAEHLADGGDRYPPGEVGARSGSELASSGRGGG